MVTGALKSKINRLCILVENRIFGPEQQHLRWAAPEAPRTLTGQTRSRKDAHSA